MHRTAAGGSVTMAQILVVEDERPLRRIIALNLARRGHSVAEADSVAAAEQAIAAWEGEFDVVLLDINLPDRSGWDLLRDLAQRAGGGRTDRRGPPARRGPRVIVMTAVRPPQARIEEFQPDAVLVKPFPLEALFRLVDRLLEALPGGATVGGSDEADEAR
jgi:CheY-like chemotaxis protein